MCYSVTRLTSLIVLIFLILPHQVLCDHWNTGEIFGFFAGIFGGFFVIVLLINWCCAGCPCSYPDWCERKTSVGAYFSRSDSVRISVPPPMISLSIQTEEEPPSYAVVEGVRNENDSGYTQCQGVPISGNVIQGTPISGVPLY
jgi:hypothetical protein